MVKNKAQFNFKGISIHYNLPNTADVYFLTGDNKYNKSVNDTMMDWGYKRLRLNKSDGLVELNLGFEYTWHGVYCRNDELYLIDRERRDNIRKAPVF